MCLNEVSWDPCLSSNSWRICRKITIIAASFFETIWKSIRQAICEMSRLMLINCFSGLKGTCFKFTATKLSSILQILKTILQISVFFHPKNLFLYLFSAISAPLRIFLIVSPGIFQAIFEIVQKPVARWILNNVIKFFVQSQVRGECCQ